jgi:hypothetical protein
LEGGEGEGGMSLQYFVKAKKLRSWKYFPNDYVSGVKTDKKLQLSGQMNLISLSNFTLS